MADRPRTPIKLGRKADAYLITKPPPPTKCVCGHIRVNHPGAQLFQCWDCSCEDFQAVGQPAQR